MKVPQLSFGIQRSDALQCATGGGLLASACVDVTVRGGKACIKVPIKGRECISAPGVPDAGTVSVCCDVKKKKIGFVKVPYKVECCLKYEGMNIKCKSWGL